MYQDRAVAGPLSCGGLRPPRLARQETWGSALRVLIAGDVVVQIRAVLVSFLRAWDEANGYELGLNEGCDLGPAPDGIDEQPPRDFRGGEADQPADDDTVICGAVLSDDPLGHLNLAAAHSLNLERKLRLARGLKHACAEHILFASSCSLYIANGCPKMTEDTDVLRVADYGETNVLAERGPSLPTDGSFCLVYRLNATPYGAAPHCAPASS